MKTWIVGAGLALVLGAPQRALANEPAAPGSAVKDGNAVPAANAAEQKQVAPDNTGRNERDRSANAVTPMDQSNDPKDVALTQQIRKVVVGDDALSMNAHNVKIISANGVVTLRGPVDSPQEKAKIEAAAAQAAGAKNVRNELEVTASR
ncbi:BON domain-containing protein [Candidatus Binatia bacterium]|jgi:osmotically-inducible protein OsmY|nr:BON domain-containing protein [Candidatus Binatia bacterium]